MVELESDLIEFFGTECVHCEEMTPLIERVEEDLEVTIQRLECWHNEENDQLREQFDDGFCGSVPFFYNKKTGKKLCGSVNYDKLKEWASGE